MKSDAPVHTTIDEYIADAPEAVQSILHQIRSTIRNAAPAAEETISYGMPAFRLDGPLVYFAAFKNHIGLYPPVHGDERLMQDVAPYANEKGNLRFPLDERIPYALIGRVVKARARENAERVAARTARRKVKR